jgi:Major Facilitator Superfamily
MTASFTSAEDTPAPVAFPAGRLRESASLAARTSLLIGATSASACAAVMLFFYKVLLSTAGKWFPERNGGKTGFVNGGFAYGSLPFIFVFNSAFDTANYQEVLDLIGCYVMIVVLVCAFFFKDPPKNWWPADIDPVSWSGNQKKAAGLAKNPPATRQYTPKEAVRTGMLPLMWVTIVITAGVSIFGFSSQVAFAKQAGFGPLVAASSMGVMAVINGIGRGVVGWLSDSWAARRPWSSSSSPWAWPSSA